MIIKLATGNKYPFVFLLFAMLLAMGFHANAQSKIILKLDDIGVKNGNSKAKPVFDDLLKRKIKVSCGVIAKNLDSTSPQFFAPYLSATNDKGEKLFEIWSHGWDHSNNNPPNNNKEFDGTSYGFQLEHFNHADAYVKQLLGVQMHTFGSPYNASDSTFNKVISQNKNYKVFMLNGMKTPETNGVANFNNRVNMESSTGNVNFDYFVTQYQKLKDKYPDYMVLQGHAQQWDAAKLAEFDKILDYLIAQKCEFVLPYDYYLQTHPSK